MISYKMFEAFIKDLLWRDRLADLLGPEWDAAGSNLYETIWEDVYVTWGEAGTDFIGEFLDWVESNRENETPYVTDTESDEDFYAESIEGLWELLNKYFVKEEA